MRRTILAVMMLGASVGVQAMDNKEAAAFQKKMDRVMVEILCKTRVIRDMNALGEEYLPKLRKISDPALKKMVKAEFGGKLHQAWLNQNFDMRKHQDIVGFLRFMNDRPMKDQSVLAKSWAYSAHQQCPAVADDYLQTNAASLTLISTIPY